MVRTMLVPSHRSKALGAAKLQAAPHSITRFVAQVMSGAVVSRKVMVWLHTLELAQLSLALQVRVTLKRNGQANPLVLVTVLRIRMVTLVPSQASTAEGGVKESPVPHSLVMLGEQLNTGAVVSRTVMVWLQVAELPQRSVALHTLTTVKRVGQTSPVVLVVVLTATTSTLVPSQLSNTAGVIRESGAPHSMVTLVAQVRAGGVVSTTVMVWLQVLKLPHWSVARQVRTATRLVGQPTVAVLVTVL